MSDLIKFLRTSTSSAYNKTAADLIEELNERLTAATDDAKEAEAYAEELEARIEELVKERDELGRKLNIARYGQPDFAWAIHEEAMADLRAKLAKAVEALETIVDNGGAGSYHLARAVLAELEGKK